LSHILKDACTELVEVTTYPFSWADFEAEALDPANHIAFTPVPRTRNRRMGWSPDRQRLFLFALARCGSVISFSGNPVRARGV